MGGACVVSQLPLGPDAATPDVAGPDAGAPDALPADAPAADAAEPRDAGPRPDAAIEDPWVRTFWERGSSPSIVPAALAIGPAGEVIAAASHDLPLRVATATLAPQGTDAVVVAWTAGGELAWLFPIGGSGDQRIHTVATTTSGAVLIGGEFQGELEIGGAIVASAQTTDAFVARFDPSSNTHRVLVLGGGGTDRIQRLVAGSGVLYAGGTFTEAFTGGACDFETGTNDGRGSSQAFVAAIDLRSFTCVWAHGFGGGGGETLQALAWDPQRERIIAAGRYASDLVLRGATGQRDQTLRFRNDRGAESYVLVFDASGAFAAATFIGGPRDELVLDLIVDPSGNLRLAGAFAESGVIESGSGILAVTGQIVGLTLDRSLGVRGAFLVHRTGGDSDDIEGVAITWARGVVVIAANLEEESSYRIGRDSITADTDDAVVIGFEPASGAPIWVEHLSSSARDEATGAVFDPTAERLVIGGGFEAALALPGAGVVEPHGGRDAFVLRYRP